MTPPHTAPPIHQPATSDGAVGMLVPVKETVFKRLNMLQILMTRALPHEAGLNPEGFRYYPTPPCLTFVVGVAADGSHTTLCSLGFVSLHSLMHDTYRSTNRQKRVADGTLLYQYLSLDVRTQRQLARVLGTTAEVIIGNLTDLDAETFIV